MAVGGCLKIKYTGASASCLLQGDAVAKTLTSLIGAAGAEAADAAFGVAGVLDLTGATVDTLAELAAVIEAYANYTATVEYGDDIATENILTHTVQAKGVYGYVLFNLATSVLSATALTTWARVQALLGTSGAPNTDQTLVEYLINSISDQAEMIAGGRRLKSRSYSPTGSTPYIFDGNGREEIILPEWPVTAISHVYIDSTRAWGAATEIDAADFVFDVDTGLLYYPGRTLTAGIRNLRIDRTAGWATVPDYVQQAVVETVIWTRSRLRGSNIGMRSVGGPNGISSSYEIEIPMSARKVFESLRGGRI
jgi:hypothetical protein